MTKSFVISVIGDDKPGLVGSLAKVIKDHGGEWVESRMANLAHKFSGVVRIKLANSKQQSLTEALEGLVVIGLHAQLEACESDAEDETQFTAVHLDLIGPDRVGIVHQLTNALASLAVSVAELETEVVEASMSSELLFKATAELQVPNSVCIDTLSEQLDDIANQLTVDIRLEEAGIGKAA